MGTDVINTADATFAVYPEFTVLLGPDGGATPGLANVFEDAYCIRVVQSASGSRLDYAELLHSLNDHLRDLEQPENFARMVEVRMPDVSDTLLHRGDYVATSLRIDQSGESFTAQSHVRNYHFGVPLDQFDVWNPLSSAAGYIESDVVFNPTIDNVTVFNRSDVVRTAEVDQVGYLWCHPELASNTVGETYQGQTRNEWTLLQAVTSICELLNGEEEFVVNPFGMAATLAGSPPLRNVTIPIGTWLPQALDMLLIPLGYNWFLDYETDTEKADIVVFKIGVGTEKELLFQAPGESLNLAQSNVNQLQVSSSIADAINAVTVLGEHEEAECTFPLFAAWDATHDVLDSADLAKDGADYLTHETVWRLFIANEAGDINPAVSRLGQLPAVPDLSAIFTSWIPHRRVLGEPLTFIEGTPSSLPQRRTFVVDWSDDAGVTWQSAPDEWVIKLCPNQIGILFDGKNVPTELYDAGDNGRLRITGTVFADSRVFGYATKQAWSGNGRLFEAVILRPEKFQNRWRNETGTYQSVLTGAADERDDSTDIQTFAEKLRDQNQYTEIDCEFRLPGWHLEYQIGDLITKVAGREISLDQGNRLAPDYRYVQIVERRFEMSKEGGPSTVLIVDRGIAPVRQ